jgi:predicted nuclease of predicted toxin-antitoxin system
VAIIYYFDQNVARAIANGVRMRGIDVLTAFEDGRAKWDDVALLDRAAELGRVFFTHDRDFLRDAARRQRAGIHFAGIVFAQMEQSLIKVYIHDLAIIAQVASPSEMENQVLYLPL